MIILYNCKELIYNYRKDNYRIVLKEKQYISVESISEEQQKEYNDNKYIIHEDSTLRNLTSFCKSTDDVFDYLAEDMVMQLKYYALEEDWNMTFDAIEYYKNNFWDIVQVVYDYNKDISYGSFEEYKIKMGNK
jgi:hypothetical protein